jgi:hypothetical protein
MGTGQLGTRKRVSEPMESTRAFKKPYTPSCNNQASTKEFPPKLTADEKHLLRIYEGCHKCRVFYAGHLSNQCNVKLSGKGYKTLTLEDAIHAQELQGSKAMYNYFFYPLPFFL